MSERKKRLEETAQFLRSRLWELQRAQVADVERPMRDVAITAVRNELTEVGRELSRLAVL